MCRWLAYRGESLHLERLIFEPHNSLASQSLAARHSHWPTNGDGFGVGWYGSRDAPGLFRDVLPAWNDSNLRSVSEQVRSGLFFAHVRASTGAPTARSNCHPFRHRHWLFMHNGQIGGFDRVRRQLMLSVAPELFAHIEGRTDSELFFYLLLGNGADTDPAGAFARTVGDVLRVMDEAGVTEPFRMCAALTDGDAVHAVRFASDDNAPSLFHGGAELIVDGDGVLIASEPLGTEPGLWNPVPQPHWLRVDAGGVTSGAFSPA